MNTSPDFERDGERLRAAAMRSLFDDLTARCEGAVMVDADARIVWVSAKYARHLGLDDPAQALGRDVEEVIPNSRLREVVRTGQPLPLDVMPLGTQQWVVGRYPVRDEEERVIGAVGYVVYDQVHALGPLMAKYAALEGELARARRVAADGRRARHTLDAWVGEGRAAADIKHQVRRIAAMDSNVLILGETGTGKELLAHAIHNLSRRALGPFIAVNVAAVPEALIEAEFFGTAPGAYTDAGRRGREGKFVVADGGTLFLDEIGELALGVQAKLLRALQEREVEALGSNRVERVDVRVLAATSVDLARRVAEGRFRADLYYRLNVLNLTLPALRERSDDLEPLCSHLLQQIAERLDLPLPRLAPAAVERLRRHDWPGNVRELRNVLERATLFAETQTLSVADVERALNAQRALEPARTAGAASLAAAAAEAERRTILEALEAVGGNRAAAAKRLGVSRATLYEKLYRLGLAQRAVSGSPDN